MNALYDLTLKNLHFANALRITRDSFSQRSVTEMHFVVFVCVYVIVTESLNITKLLFQ